MIKLQSRSYKLLGYSFLTLETLSILSIFILNKTTHSKMGMLRHMIYLNSRVESSVNIKTIKYILIVALVLSLIWTSKNFLQSTYKSKLSFLWTLVLNLYSLFFILMRDTSLNKSYYYIASLLVWTSLVQSVLYFWQVKRNRPPI